MKNNIININKLKKTYKISNWYLEKFGYLQERANHS